MRHTINSVITCLALTACDDPRIAARMGALHSCADDAGSPECTADEATDGDASGAGESDGDAGTTLDPGDTDDGASSGHDPATGGDPQPPSGCWGETIPWYQPYVLYVPVESCHFASPEGAVPWVGTSGQTALFYNISAARIGHRNFTAVDCAQAGDPGTFLTVQYSQFYSASDTLCDDIAFVDRTGSSALTSLTPLIGD
jgi:hypothetical protein